MNGTEQAQWAQVRRETMETCKVAECDRLADGSRGWCWAHYMRWHSSGQEPSGPVARVRQTPERCSVEGCPRNKRDYCNPHGKRVRRYGVPGPANIKTTTPAGTKNGVYRTGGGYVLVVAPDGYEGKKYRGKYALQHVLVMAEMLGRPLLPSENVHHRNGDRTDNRPENLELWSTHQPKGQRVADKLAWAREIIDLYGDLPPEVNGTA